MFIEAKYKIYFTFYIVWGHPDHSDHQDHHHQYHRKNDHHYHQHHHHHYHHHLSLNIADGVQLASGTPPENIYPQKDSTQSTPISIKMSRWFSGRLNSHLIICKDKNDKNRILRDESEDETEPGLATRNCEKSFVEKFSD